MNVHVFVSRMQPATAVYYGPELGIKPFWIRRSPRRLMRCQCCWRLRWAAKIGVQVYYDGDRCWCLDRAECKAWQKAKRRRERLARKPRRP